MKWEYFLYHNNNLLAFCKKFRFVVLYGGAELYGTVTQKLKSETSARMCRSEF